MYQYSIVAVEEPQATNMVAQERPSPSLGHGVVAKLLVLLSSKINCLLFIVLINHLDRIIYFRCPESKPVDLESG